MIRRRVRAPTGPPAALAVALALGIPLALVQAVSLNAVHLGCALLLLRPKDQHQHQIQLFGDLREGVEAHLLPPDKLFPRLLARVLVAFERFPLVRLVHERHDLFVRRRVDVDRGVDLFERVAEVVDQDPDPLFGSSALVALCSNGAVLQLVCMGVQDEAGEGGRVSDKADHGHQSR